MNCSKFKRWGNGILYLIGNGKTIFFDRDKIKELHNLIHEYEKNPNELQRRKDGWK